MNLDVGELRNRLRSRTQDGEPDPKPEPKVVPETEPSTDTTDLRESPILPQKPVKMVNPLMGELHSQFQRRKQKQTTENEDAVQQGEQENQPPKPAVSPVKPQMNPFLGELNSRLQNRRIPEGGVSKPPSLPAKPKPSPKPSLSPKPALGTKPTQSPTASPNNSQLPCFPSPPNNSANITNGTVDIGLHTTTPDGKSPNVSPVIIQPSSPPVDVSTPGSKARKMDKCKDLKDNEEVLSFRARRKAKARDQATHSTPSTYKGYTFRISSKRQAEPKVLRLVQASSQYQSKALTCILYELSVANTFNSFELYLSLFRILFPSTLRDLAFEHRLYALGYTVQITEISNKASCTLYLHSKGWTLDDVIRWTKGQYPLVYEELWTGVLLYGLLVGKELNPCNYKHWVNKRAKAFYSHHLLYKNGDFSWSVDTFTSQPTARYIYLQLYAQPIRNTVFGCLRSLKNYPSFWNLGQTVLKFLAFSNMTHIFLIQKHVMAYPTLLDVPALQPYVPDLNKALSFLERMPAEDRPFARLLRDHEECKVLSSKKLMPFIVTARLIMEDKRRCVKRYQGVDIPPQLDYLREYLKPHIEKAMYDETVSFLARKGLVLTPEFQKFIIENLSRYSS